MTAWDDLVAMVAAANSAERPVDTGTHYRLTLSDQSGLLLCEEYVWADTAESAINLAMQRLRQAPVVEIWSQARWVGQVQRSAALH